MNKICTSIEQSQKLVELGVDVKTADMYYEVKKFGNAVSYSTTPKVKTAIVDKRQKYGLPVWSLSALLSMIKPVNDNTYTLIGTIDGGAMLSFDEITNVMFQEEEIVDAAFEMICWLKEKKLL